MRDTMPKEKRKKSVEDKAKEHLAKEGEKKEEPKQGRLAPPDKEKLEALKTEVVDYLAKIDGLKESLADAREVLSSTLKDYKKAKGE